MLCRLAAQRPEEWLVFVNTTKNQKQCLFSWPSLQRLDSGQGNFVGQALNWRYAVAG